MIAGKDTQSYATLLQVLALLVYFATDPNLTDVNRRQQAAQGNALMSAFDNKHKRCYLVLSKHESHKHLD